MSWARNSVGERGDNIGLPDVTTADNGKIMEVESGEWKLKEGSGGGGGGLPEITEADEGKFLGVVSGEAAWAEGGGGGSSPVVVVNITNIVSDNDGGYNGEADITALELEAAYNAGKIIMARLVSPPVDFEDFPKILSCYRKADGYSVFYFSGTSSSGNYPPEIYSVNMTISNGTPDYILIKIGVGRTQEQD